ncbi:MAG: lysophospholipid acyltransferase family protein [Bacteroidota bacterium]
MNIIKKILSYPLSILHYIVYGLILVIFQPIQWLSLKLGGYSAHKKSVDALSACLVASLFVLGTRVRFINKHHIPEGAPLIIASNHQSMHDITGIGWMMRKYHPKFVSKIELGKGIPSISFNLKYGGSVLIDRGNPKQSLPAIMKFGKYLEEHNRSAVIFPEGTRSKDGVPKPFHQNGLKMMVKYAPSSFVVPITINNSWKLLKHGHFPLEIGLKLTFEAHEPMKIDSMPFAELFQKTEKAVKDAVIV